MSLHSVPRETARMPEGIPQIIGNEAAERFSFYGMKAILAVFLSQYLFLMDGSGGSEIGEVRAAELVHWFNGAFYLTPILGAILADVFFGKYRVIIWLSIVYCLGHGALALMGSIGSSGGWLVGGLVLLAIGAGGIKPCVSAHVGDQFGAKNSHLLPKIYNWFYFSINLGAFLSMLLTPWLLEWYGPHWAFGVPGVLMAIATVVFWSGRKKFVHVPAGGSGFLKELLSREGLVAIGKLVPVYLFVAVFWALFDQTGSTWIFQSMDMDRSFLGFEWLPSQIQSLNSVFVLTFIPLFSLVIYPWVGRVWKLSPLRKMGTGFILMTAAFVVVSLIQVRIDAGNRPNISWQIGAFALLTAAEVLISIVALEFAYTQAPKKMKSFVMCFFLAAVAVGNFLVAGVNHSIRIPSAAQEQMRLVGIKGGSGVLSGYDRAAGTLDDFQISDGNLVVPGQGALDAAADSIVKRAEELGRFPDKNEGKDILAAYDDVWGKPLEYLILNANAVRIWSAGGDGLWNTKWDIGVIVERSEEVIEAKTSWLDRLRPASTWLENRKIELGLEANLQESGKRVYSRETFSGGQVKMHGAEYFWFFTKLMGITALLFIPFAMLYQPREYLQRE